MKKYWYAALTDREDWDLGEGSFDLEEAKQIASRYENGCIAVIDANYDDGNATSDWLCIEEIAKEDF